MFGECGDPEWGVVVDGGHPGPTDGAEREELPIVEFRFPPLFRRLAENDKDDVQRKVVGEGTSVPARSADGKFLLDAVQDELPGVDLVVDLVDLGVHVVDVSTEVF